MKDNVFYLKLADYVTSPPGNEPRGLIIDDLCIITGLIRLEKEFRNDDFIAYLPDSLVPKYNRFITCFYINGSNFDSPKMMMAVEPGQPHQGTIMIVQGGSYKQGSSFCFAGQAYCLT